MISIPPILRPDASQRNQSKGLKNRLFEKLLRNTRTGIANIDRPDSQKLQYAETFEIKDMTGRCSDFVRVHGELRVCCTPYSTRTISDDGDGGKQVVCSRD